MISCFEKGKLLPFPKLTGAGEESVKRVCLSHVVIPVNCEIDRKRWWAVTSVTGGFTSHVLGLMCLHLETGSVNTALRIEL